MLGLILIAFGTGGIKPCVAAFGGDQFDEENVSARSHEGCSSQGSLVSHGVHLLRPGEREAEVLLHLLHVDQRRKPPVHRDYPHPER